METITIQTTDGDRKVPAVMHGNLAVHDLEPHEGWRITHVPTGLSVAQGFAEKVDAIACAKQLNEIHDWDFADASKPFISVEAAQRVMATVEYCGGFRLTSPR